MAEVEWILGTVDRFCGFGRMGIWGQKEKKKRFWREGRVKF